MGARRRGPAQPMNILRPPSSTDMAPSRLIEPAEMAVEAGTPDFAWPDFDRWQAAFAAARNFPPRWEGLHRAPPAHTPEAETYRLRKLSLFSEWLDLLARRSTVHAHFARQGIRARVERQDMRLPCPACDPFNAREVGAELEAMPPFHPGCRCVVLAVPVEPAGRRRRPFERSR